MTDLLTPSQRSARISLSRTMAKAVPNFYRPLGHVDLIEDRTHRPIRVLCLGMPRTGTYSLAFALQELGYRPYNHSRAMATGWRDMPCWCDAIDAKFWGKGNRWGREEFDKVLAGYDCVQDLPATYFCEELLACYPDAKVILTEIDRPFEDWVCSIGQSIGVSWSWRSWPLIVWADPLLMSPWWAMVKRSQQISPWLDSLTSDHQRLRAWYEGHYARVRSLCPKERLLEFKTGRDGWEELCEFLDKDVPKRRKYPRVGESAIFVPMYSVLWWRAFRIAATKVLLSGSVGLAVTVLMWRRRGRLEDVFARLKTLLR